jgi:hypothetical protein
MKTNPQENGPATLGANRESFSPQGNLDRKLWKISDLARYLDVPETWIYDRTQTAAQDRIPHFKLGKYLRFDPESIEFKAWLERNFRR